MFRATMVSSLPVRMFYLKGPGLPVFIGPDWSDKWTISLVQASLVNRGKAQRHLADVMIETEAPFDIEYRDPNLEKILKLSPADLRFIDALIAKVEGSDETEWVGSDQWIR